MSQNQKLDLNDFLTSPLRDEETQSIVSNLFNRFLSEEKSVQISGQIGLAPSPNVSDIVAPDFDRDQNVLIPAIHVKTGTEESAFTFDDLVNRLNAIGVNTNDLRGMLAESTFNFMPPINLDKFVNYSNYYWVGKSVASPLAWNPSMMPEYYTIQKPDRTGQYKIPVRVATTRPVKLWGKDRARENVSISFNTDQTFTITGDQGVLYAMPQALVSTNPGAITTVNVFAPDVSDPNSNGFGLSDPSTNNDPLFSFNITNGDIEFDAGDTFIINIEYVSGANMITFTPVTSNISKGFVSNIIPDKSLMYIDGVQVFVGDSVLVKNQTNTAENGIYIVEYNKWIRRADTNTENGLPLNSIVFVRRGDRNGGYTYYLSSREPTSTFILNDPANGQMTWEIFSTTDPSPINDWQYSSSFWYHRDELSLVPAAQQATAIQATRPIIEYSNRVHLNKFVDGDGYPSSSGTAVAQSKSIVNQIPQFDLFRYDGTHARKTSSIFFYVEDPDYPVDPGLQRRVKITTNADYIFGLGIEDEKGRLLYWKDGAELQGIWSSGPEPEPVYPSPPIQF